MKNKNISRACLAAALVMAGTVSAHASALRSSAPETEAAVMIMDNTRMARPKAKIVKEYAPTNRPAESERLFRSEAVEAEIARIKGVLSNAKLAWMFENCFPNTLDTTVRYRKDDNGRDDTVVYTGDIHAMWLRDSGAQVWPYLQLANKDEHLRSMLAGVIRRQFKCIELDPYANAFLDPYDPNPDHQWMSDQTQMRPELHERKWEIDSLCYPLRLAYEYWLVTGDDSVFDEHWMAAIRNILKTFREQQRKEGVGPYTFMRVTDRQLDTVCNMGKGNPVNPVGLIASVFRPSDDATTFLFLVPSNFIGGPHVGYDMAWPMSIMMKAFTSQDDAEIKRCVEMLMTTDAGTGFMHESFNVNDPTDFTRSWFAWQNTLFGELILKLVNEGKVDLLNSITVK